MHKFLFVNQSSRQIYVPSSTCWGCVVIGSLSVYQTSGAGSNPVVSTTDLAYAIRSIGSDQKSCNSFAWESLEKSGLFLIFFPAYGATLLYFTLYLFVSSADFVSSVLLLSA